MKREEQKIKTNVEILRLNEIGLDIREISSRIAIKKSYIVKVLLENKKFKNDNK